MKKIEKLTEAQIAEFPRFVREWTAHGLCSKPADRARAEQAISQMYRGANLSQPKVVWADSPLAGALTAMILKNQRNSVGDSVWASVWDSVGDSVRGSVWNSVWNSVGDTVGDSVWASVWDSVGDSVWNSVWDSVGDTVGNSVWAAVGGTVGAAVGGQHEAHWLAFYRYFFEVCGLEKETEALDGLWLLSQSCGWIYPYKGVCIATERPKVCLTDENGLIHNDTGPAIAYPDGFSIYAWHGTRVPPHWIEEADSLDPLEVLKSENVEQRAAGASIIGWPKMAKKLDRRIIDGDPNSDIGALVELTLPGLSEPGRFLMAKCPRNGTICEGVPRISDIDNQPIETAIAAQAWRDCLPAAEYSHPNIRT